MLLQRADQLFRHVSGENPVRGVAVVPAGAQQPGFVFHLDQDHGMVFVILLQMAAEGGNTESMRLLGILGDEESWPEGKRAPVKSNEEVFTIFLFS